MGEAHDWRVSMKESLHLRCVIQENARRINQMRERIQETFARRGEGPEAWAAWGFPLRSSGASMRRWLFRAVLNRD